jgi:hypothetical protein
MCTSSYKTVLTAVQDFKPLQFAVAFGAAHNTRTTARPIAPGNCKKKTSELARIRACFTLILTQYSHNQRMNVLQVVLSLILRARPAAANAV